MFLTKKSDRATNDVPGLSNKGWKQEEIGGTEIKRELDSGQRLALLASSFFSFFLSSSISRKQLPEGKQKIHSYLRVTTNNNVHII